MTKEYSREVIERNIIIAFFLHALILIESPFLYYYNSLAMTLIIMVIELIVPILVLLYLVKMKEINIKGIFKWENIKYILIGSIAIIAVGRFFIYLMAEVYGKEMILELINEGTINSKNLKGINLIEFYIATLIYCPICEEFECRYVIMGNIGKKSKMSMIISSIIFSLFHYNKNIIMFTMHFTMGMVLAIVYRKTERIEISMIIHMMNNLLSG